MKNVLIVIALVLGVVGSGQASGAYLPGEELEGEYLPEGSVPGEFWRDFDDKLVMASTIGPDDKLTPEKLGNYRALLHKNTQFRDAVDFGDVEAVVQALETMSDLSDYARSEIIESFIVHIIKTGSFINETGVNRLEVLHEAGINLGAPFITEGDQGLTPLELASMLGKQDVVDAIHAIIFVDQA